MPSVCDQYHVYLKPNGNSVQFGCLVQSQYHGAHFASIHSPYIRTVPAPKVSFTVYREYCNNADPSAGDHQFVHYVQHVHLESNAISGNFGYLFQFQYNCALPVLNHNRKFIMATLLSFSPGGVINFLFLFLFLILFLFLFLLSSSARILKGVWNNWYRE